MVTFIRAALLHRKLARRLHDGGWTPEKLNPRVTSLAAGAITAASVKGAALVVMGRPTVPLTAAEIAVLHAFVAEVHPSCLHRAGRCLRPAGALWRWLGSQNPCCGS